MMMPIKITELSGLLDESVVLLGDSQTICQMSIFCSVVIVDDTIVILSDVWQ